MLAIMCDSMRLDGEVSVLWVLEVCGGRFWKE